MGIGLGNLQIVNSESLGVSYDNNFKRKFLIKVHILLISEVKSKAMSRLNLANVTTIQDNASTFVIVLGFHLFTNNAKCDWGDYK